MHLDIWKKNIFTSVTSQKFSSHKLLNRGNWTKRCYSTIKKEGKKHVKCTHSPYYSIPLDISGIILFLPFFFHLFLSHPRFNEFLPINCESNRVMAHRCVQRVGACSVCSADNCRTVLVLFGDFSHGKLLLSMSPPSDI